MGHGPVEPVADGQHDLPIERWFSLGAQGTPYNELTTVTKRHLEVTGDRLYAIYSSGASHFHTAIAECYYDIASFGTCILYQEADKEKKMLLFRSIPLANAWMDTGEDGQVDTIYVTMQMSGRQITQKFPDLARAPKLRERIEKDTMGENEYTIVHSVFPNDEVLPALRDIPSSRREKSSKDFQAHYWCKDTIEVLESDGYDTLPYHVGRWITLPGEVYARGPGYRCIDTVRMVNAMERTHLKAAQKAVDPSLVVPHSGYMLPLRTHPGSIIYKESGTPDIQVLDMKHRPEMAFESINYHRQVITRTFHVDWILREKKKERQTAHEVMDDRNEMLGLMAPMTSRLQSEWLSQIIKRSLLLMTDMDMFDPLPDELRGRNMAISYTSPAATAQFGHRTVANQQFIQDMMLAAQVDPKAMMPVNFDGYAYEMQALRGASPKLLHTKEQLRKLKEQVAQQEEQQQMLQAAQPMASAVKDLAEAQSKGFSG